MHTSNCKIISSHRASKEDMKISYEDRSDLMTNHPSWLFFLSFFDLANVIALTKRLFGDDAFRSPPLVVGDTSSSTSPPPL